jgi:hypothetical protein
MLGEDLQGGRQGVVTAGGGAVDVAAECSRESLVEPVPPITPDLGVEGDEHIQHGGVAAPIPMVGPEVS